jgi:hypothetical protein
VQLAVQVVPLRVSPWDPGDATRKGTLLDPGDEEVLEQSNIWGYSHKVLPQMCEGCQTGDRVGGEIQQSESESVHHLNKEISERRAQTVVEVPSKEVKSIISRREGSWEHCCGLMILRLAHVHVRVILCQVTLCKHQRENSMSPPLCSLGGFLLIRRRTRGLSGSLRRHGEICEGELRSRRRKRRACFCSGPMKMMSTAAMARLGEGGVNEQRPLWIPFYGESAGAGSLPSYVAALFRRTTSLRPFHSTPPTPAFNAHHGGRGNREDYDSYPLPHMPVHYSGLAQ